jgi:serine phosphatase RsbU (regulator of sigma subunit)
MSGLKLFQDTKFPEAMAHARRGIEIFSHLGHSDLQGISEMGYGACLRSLGEIDLAVDHFLKAAELIDPEGKFCLYQGYTNYQLAEIYLYIRDFETAEKHFNISTKIAETLGHRTPLFRNWNGTGNLKMALNKYDEAFDYLNKALKISEAHNERSRAMCDLGVYYLSNDRLDKALEFLNESYQIRHANGLNDAASTSQIHLAETYLKLNQPKKSLELIEEALATSEKFNAKGKIASCYKILREVHEKLGNWQRAVEFYAKYDYLQEQLNSVKLQNIYKLKNHKIEQQKQIIETIHEEFQDSVRYARRIQHAILPSENFIQSFFREFFILYKPKDIVAGDFYWCERKGDTTFIATADCTGHGVPGAMVSVVCCNALHRAVNEFDLVNPGEILDKVRDLVIKTFEGSSDEVKDGMDIALCALRGKELTFAGANNPAWIVRKESSGPTLIELKPDKQPIGIFERSSPFRTQTIMLEKNDCLYLFSDGYADQFGGAKGKKFKEKNLKEYLITIFEYEMQEQRKRLSETFETWRGKLAQIDDVCVIGLRI